ncbi:hypothetical protein [Kitasatospora sp. GP82]|uniref:hypothetical protein n=1 Tax=Kitasatospora sp. GP82 TaxID=3035089 RepID=UPI002473128E|nr:hypothetical protein [Kitasatospora sp. GP82]MDH6130126.1 hypothetical protein [Kitasatospora sp. GP82]
MERTRVLTLAGVVVALLTVGLTSAADGNAAEPTGQNQATPITAKAGGKGDLAAAAAAASPRAFGTSVSVAPGTNGFASVSCPAGGSPLSGGGTTSGIHIFFTDSFASGSSWIIRGTNTGTVNENLTAYVLCTNP